MEGFSPGEVSNTVLLIPPHNGNVPYVSTSKSC